MEEQMGGKDCGIYMVIRFLRVERFSGMLMRYWGMCEG